MSNPILSKVYCVQCEFFKPHEEIYGADGVCCIHPPTVVADPQGNCLDSVRPLVKKKDFCGIGVQIVKPN